MRFFALGVIADAGATAGKRLAALRRMHKGGGTWQAGSRQPQVGGARAGCELR